MVHQLTFGLQHHIVASRERKSTIKISGTRSVQGVVESTTAWSVQTHSSSLCHRLTPGYSKHGTFFARHCEKKNRNGQVKLCDSLFSVFVVVRIWCHSGNPRLLLESALPYLSAWLPFRKHGICCSLLVARDLLLFACRLGRVAFSFLSILKSRKESWPPFWTFGAIKLWQGSSLGWKFLNNYFSFDRVGMCEENLAGAVWFRLSLSSPLYIDSVLNIAANRPKHCSASSSNWSSKHSGVSAW